MERRAFITLMGGSLLAVPLSGEAQQAGKVSRVGYLSSNPPSDTQEAIDAFRVKLRGLGYVEGENLLLDSRYAEGRYERLPQFAADLVRLKVDVVFTYSTPGALAAKKATGTIPIVFAGVSDPLVVGLVTSLTRPGGNVTGVTFLTAELVGKRLNLLLELVPQATAVGYLCPGSGSAYVEARKGDIIAAGRALGREIIVLEVQRVDFEATFAAAVEQRVGALIVGNYTVFVASLSNRNKILELAARHKLPAMYEDRRYSGNGGLMSYGARITEQARNAGLYTGRILKGEKPADLPVMQPIKFELVINLKSAKALGLTVPPTLLALADEVIE